MTTIEELNSALETLKNRGQYFSLGNRPLFNLQDVAKLLGLVVVEDLGLEEEEEEGATSYLDPREITRLLVRQ
jgi:hypothetical protein